MDWPHFFRAKLLQDVLLTLVSIDFKGGGVFETFLNQSHPKLVLLPVAPPDPLTQAIPAGHKPTLPHFEAEV